MTPKEKAEELFNKFQQDYFILVLPNGRKMYTSEIKYCALIAVDELIKYCHAEHIGYWQEVKREIQNL